MSAELLVGYGMSCIGTVRLVDSKFIITITDHPAVRLTYCIYAFLVGGEILRIGSSKGLLKVRLAAWQSDVSNAIAGKKFRTPAHEAEIWRSALSEHKEGYLFARAGTRATTPVGEFNLYLMEESALIHRHRPICCNDVDRHRVKFTSYL